MISLLRRWLGSLIIAVKGPFKTVIYRENMEEASDILRPDNLQYDMRAGITCQRIVYHTQYHRWWIPDSYTTMYEVQGHAPAEIAEKMDARLFEKMIYPLLCTKFLEWTPFPFYYAMRAYLARLDA